MADKPINISNSANVIAAQRPAVSNVAASFESASVALGSNEILDVQGVAYICAWGGGAVSGYLTKGGSAFALHDSAGAISVTASTAKLIDVRGVPFVSFASACTVVITG